MVDSINSIKNAPAPIQSDHHRNEHARGMFAKTLVRKMISPSQAIEDLQEELSAAHSERMESKEVEEYEVEDFHDHYYTEIVAQIQKEYPPEGEPQKTHIKQFLARLHERTPQSSEELQTLLAEITEDQAEGFAILQATLDQSGDVFQEATQQLLTLTTRNLIARQSIGIQAGANTISLARAAAKKLGADVTQLQKTYQSMVSSYEGILPALTKIANEKGVAQFENISDFIMGAAAKDLSATRASVQPARLQRILAEFQGIKMFNTLRDWSKNMLKRFEPQLKEKAKFKKNELFTRALKFISSPESFNTQILLPLKALTPSEKVLVLQGLRGGVRSLPNYLFPSGEAAKSRILFPVQNEIDQLVFEQDA